MHWLLVLTICLANTLLATGQLDFDTPFEKVALVKTSPERLEKRFISSAKLVEASIEMRKAEGGVAVFPSESVVAIIPLAPTDIGSFTKNDLEKAFSFVSRLPKKIKDDAGINTKDENKWKDLIQNASKVENALAKDQSENKSGDPTTISETNNNSSLSLQPEDGSSEAAYNALKKQRERTFNAIKYIPRDDQSTYYDFLNLTDNYLQAFESGNIEKAKVLYARLQDKIGDTLKNKPVVAYKYNELLKVFLPTPVSFNMYKDSESFYISIGDEPFATVSTLTAENILGIVQAYEKYMRWSKQCDEERLNTTKELGRFGGLSLEFESRDDGLFNRVLVEIKGQMASDRLLSEQSVWMSNLNFACLVQRLRTAPEIYEKNKKAKENAERLR